MENLLEARALVKVAGLKLCAMVTLTGSAAGN